MIFTFGSLKQPSMRNSTVTQRATKNLLSPANDVRSAYNLTCRFSAVMTKLKHLAAGITRSTEPLVINTLFRLSIKSLIFIVRYTKTPSTKAYNTASAAASVVVTTPR